VRTYEGEVNRLPAASEPADRLLTALPTASVTTARVHEPDTVGFDGAFAEGIAVDVGERETSATADVVFEPGAAAPDGVAEWATGADPVDAEVLETTAEDGTVVFRATVPTEDLTELWSDNPGPPGVRAARAAPQVAVDFEYEPVEGGRGRLTIAHHGGDAVSVDELVLRGGGFAAVPDVDQTESGRLQGTRGADGQVSAGKAVPVGVAADYEVDVVWVAADGDASATLATDRGPDA